MNQLPMNEGFYPSISITEPGKLEPAKLKFPVGTTFTDLCKDYALFTYAPIVLYGNLSFDPLLQFYEEHSTATRPSLIITDKPIFTGLETGTESALKHVLFAFPVFNHMLNAVPIEVWNDLSFHMGTIGMRNNEQKLYFETVIQKLPMVDHLALKKDVVTSPAPTVDIYGVALDGNKCCLHFIPATEPPQDKIRFVKSPPRAQIVQFAETLFAGKPVLERTTDE